MKRAYLLIYNDAMGTREEVKEFIDKHQEISNWRYDLPHMFYLISEKSAGELYEIIQELNKEKGFFLICEAGENKEGWLPEDTWTLMREKHEPR